MSWNAEMYEGMVPQIEFRCQVFNQLVYKIARKSWMARDLVVRPEMGMSLGYWAEVEAAGSAGTGR